MFWRATLKDGTVKQHQDHDIYGPASRHHDLDPAQVAKFEIIEGGQVLWSMDNGMPKTLRMRTTRSPGSSRVILQYVLVMPSEVVFVFADGRIAKLPDFIPEGIAPGTYGTVVVGEHGDVTIDGVEFPRGCACFRPFDVPHHENETHAHMRPDAKAVTA